MDDELVVAVVVAVVVLGVSLARALCGAGLSLPRSSQSSEPDVSVQAVRGKKLS